MLTLDGVEGALGVVGLQVAHDLAHDQGQLNLKVHVDTLGTDARSIAGSQHRRRRLEEEEGLLGLGIGQLRNVVTVSIKKERKC